MKTCPKCEQTKPLDAFPRNKSRKDSRGSTCKPCQREYAKNHYANNSAYYKKKAKKLREVIREFVREVKHMKPCVDCETAYPYYVMQFDHRENKQFNVSDGFKLGSLSAIKAEIEKCELVCANCHAERTWGSS